MNWRTSANTNPGDLSPFHGTHVCKTCNEKRGGVMDCACDRARNRRDSEENRRKADAARERQVHEGIPLEFMPNYPPDNRRARWDWLSRALSERGVDLARRMDMALWGARNDPELDAVLEPAEHPGPQENPS